MLWFGYTIWSKVAVTVLITFFPITVNTFDGLSSGKKETRELFLTMGATKKDIFLKYSIPTALPHFFSGLKVAVTLSVIGAAIGEWLGAQAGLGYFSRRMMTQFDGAAVFAPIVVLTSRRNCIICHRVTYIENRLLKWRTNKLKKLTLILGKHLAFILLLSACNKEENEKVSIMLDWYPNAVHSFLYVAEEKGYFEEEGIEFDIQFPANPTDPINLAAAGKVTMGITYQPDVIIAKTEQDIGIKSVGALVRSPLNHVAFLEGKWH